jgi:alkanesulfonate monooxygenase
MIRDPEFLWYIPNQSEAGHRGDAAEADHNGLDTLTRQARAIEDHGWTGALLGTGWGRPDCSTIAAALAARTTTFEPLVAIRPGHWQPAQVASAAATLDHLTGGRVRVNVVSGRDDLAAYGDAEADPARRYARTAEFMRLIRRLWTEEYITFAGAFYRVTGSTVVPRSAASAGIPGSISAALRRRRSACRQLKPTFSCSGVSRSTACGSGSSA